MKNLTGKYLRTFFLIVAALIFNAHMIIPHDHHLPGIDRCSGNGLPFTAGNHDKHHKIPMHCHAFNDLASEKAHIFMIAGQPPALDMIPGYKPGFHLLLTSPVRHHVIVTFTAQSSPGEIILRGPPGV